MLEQLHHPWMIAAWPGMGQVAVSAAYYLMAKLQMYQLGEFSARHLFDLDYIEVENGVIRPGRRPRIRLFVWSDPNHNHDIIVFLGEAQPPSGKYAFCDRLIEFARKLGIERVFTFAAMATDMHPSKESRVFGAATREEDLPELHALELELLKNGQISGLNGALLGVAMEQGIPGVCLLGEMPHLFAQIPYPKASVAVLEAFTAMARIPLDLSELMTQAENVDKQLGSLLRKIEQAMKHGEEAENQWSAQPEIEEYRRQGLNERDRKHIEFLFGQAARDRSKAFELKAELDRLHAFEAYEDRFLDLFKKP